MAYMVVNSRYNPFTFDELVKPLQLYTEEYNRQEQLANDYLTKAALLENLSPETDKAQYDSYREWRAQLQQASDALAANGLNPQLRGTLVQLGNRYASDYAPLEDRIKTRSGLIKEQREYQQKNPNSFFDIDYSFTPLSDITPSSTYRTYDLEDIMNQVGKDVYNKNYNGEALPSMDDYIKKYGKGLTDPIKLGMIKEAVASGASLGTSTYRQKALEESLSRARLRTGRGSGSSSKLSPQKLLELQLKYPYHVINEDGSIARNDDGTLYIVPGWSQDKSGRWISPNGQIFADTTQQQTQLNPSIGVIHFNEKGEVKRHASTTQWNNDPTKVSGTPASSAADLSEENIMRLANELGLSEEEAINEDYVFNLARARGVTIDIIGPATNERKVKKEGQRGRTKEAVSNPKQQMILTGHSFGKTGTVNQEEWTGDEL